MNIVWNAYGSDLQNPLPLKEPFSLLSYQVDLALAFPEQPALDTAADPIVQLTLAIQPSGAGELMASNLSLVAPSGTLVAFKLSAGIPGRNYILDLQATTRSGLVFDFVYWCGVDRLLRSRPIPPAPSPFFSEPITWVT